MGLAPFSSRLKKINRETSDKMIYKQTFVTFLYVLATANAFAPSIGVQSTRIDSTKKFAIEFADIMVPGLVFTSAMAASVLVENTANTDSTTDSSPVVAAVSSDASALLLESEASIESAESETEDTASEETKTKGIVGKSMRVLKKVVAPWRKWENIN